MAEHEAIRKICWRESGSIIMSYIKIVITDIDISHANITWLYSLLEEAQTSCDAALDRAMKPQSFIRLMNNY